LVFRWTSFSPSRAATVATLPSALFVERFVRSVQVGCSRFSRCCHLIVDLASIYKMEVGQAIDAVTETRLWPCARFLPDSSTKLLPASAQTIPALLRRCGANLIHCRSPFYLLRFERVDNLGAYSIPSETGLLIPSDYVNHPDASPGLAFPVMGLLPVCRSTGHNSMNC
jgi:hypothetical protein